MATKAQRSVFREVLRRARADAKLSQRDLARLVGVSPGAVSQWEMGATAPREETTATLEQVLSMHTGAFAGLLGYAPASALADEAVTSVAAAIEADTQLGDRERRLLMTVYRELVRNSGATPS